MVKGNGGKLLIIDDDRETCSMLSTIMEREHLTTLFAHDSETAFKSIHSEEPDVVLIDINIFTMNGMAFLQWVKKTARDLPVLVTSVRAEIKEAVNVMKEGAQDYLVKPFDDHEVVRAVRNALDARDLKNKLKQLSSQFEESRSLVETMGPSDAIVRLDSEVKCVAKSDLSVIITGETGSGKELVAKTIHHVSNRSHCPFVPVDCGAIPETLLESELFGHEKGAFTGADVRTEGKFVAAKGGTLFLDEASNIPRGSQAKLLRVLQEKLIYPVGGSKPRKIDVRLIVASNQDLYSLVESGIFRSDLFYRLNEFAIKVPPLRERKGDILYLSRHYQDAANGELNRSVKGFTESAVETLLTYNWPGNVRQLRSTIRRAVLLAEDEITESHLDLKTVTVPIQGLAFTPKVEGMSWSNYSFKEIIQHATIALEREILTQTLKYTGGNKAKAARLLKIDYKTIHTKIKQLEI